MKYYLAVDLGASSGRHIVGYKENGEIKLEEVYRFKNGMIKENGHLVWDTESIFANIVEGIKEAIKKFGKIESLAIDTWGVDYVLMRNNEIVYPHYAYRDGRTEEPIKEVHKIIPFEKLYETTGIQFQTFNTIYQLYADKLAGRLDGVTDFLMIPEYFTYRLTGKKVKEYTDASTGGMLSVKTKDFDGEIIDKLGLPKEIFKTPKLPPFEVGELKEDIAKIVGGQTKVVMCASHDTGSAFEAVEADEHSAILSSGTWSLLGAKIKEANTSKQSCESNYANEGGVGYYRYLKNIMGMWIVNQVQAKKGIPFGEMVELAKKSSYQELFDVNDESLSAPEDMETAIIELLKKGGKKLPSGDGDLYNCIYHSLANTYALAIKGMEDNLGKTFDKLIIVGGGAKNVLLNELVEKYTHKKVVALPIEATAIGNIKLQMEN